MIQIRAGDFVAVRTNEGSVSFAILSKQILFGGHWCFVFYKSLPEPPATVTDVATLGFNAIVDFILANRANRLTKISSRNDFRHLNGPELLVQEPLKGEVHYRIWRWKNGERLDTEYVRFTTSPTELERTAPHSGCFNVDFACSLASRAWRPGEPKWAA